VKNFSENNSEELEERKSYSENLLKKLVELPESMDEL
jgi:hypothetical protein